MCVGGVSVCEGVWVWGVCGGVGVSVWRGGGVCVCAPARACKERFLTGCF